MNFKALLLIAFVASASAFGGAAKAAPQRAVKKAVKKAPVKKAPVRKAPVKKAPVRKGGFSPSSDIGVTPPLGLFDPLGFLNRGPEAYRRYQEIEIKHGRFAMAATLGVIVTEAGIRFPGYLSISEDIKFSDVGGSLGEAYFGVPLAGWAQIMAFIAALDIAVFRQDPAYPAGDVVQDLPIDVRPPPSNSPFAPPTRLPRDVVGSSLAAASVDPGARVHAVGALR